MNQSCLTDWLIEQSSREKKKFKVTKNCISNDPTAEKKGRKKDKVHPGVTSIKVLSDRHYFITYSDRCPSMLDNYTYELIFVNTKSWLFCTPNCLWNVIIAVLIKVIIWERKDLFLWKNDFNA